jgi:hypothetical protein
MTMRPRRLPTLAVIFALASVALVAAIAVDGPRVARADDPEAAAMLAAPEEASDPRALRIAAEDVLEKSPKDATALRALLVAVARLGDPDLLDDAIDRGRAAPSPITAAALGSALLCRARAESPPDAARLREAATLLAPADGPSGRPRDALDLGYARHLLGDVPGATTAYERALDGDESLAELALRGFKSLLHTVVDLHDEKYAAAIDDLGRRRPLDPVVLRARADALERALGAEAALTFLLGAPVPVDRSPRTAARLAALLRGADRHAEALVLERRAVERGASDPVALAAVEALWREKRPLASFDDIAALEADMDRLLSAVDRDPYLAMAYRNDFAFRLRDIAATFAWRGEARTQGLADGAPKEARALLDRVVALYDEAVARIPKEAASRPFAQRWVYAAVCNDAGLMRHYWLDVRDLDRAEALYLRAFDLTDGAYMDTYFYNLQYLFGFERPGKEELWYRLARRASEAILKEAPDGGFVPDEGKREAARRDAESLRKLLDERGAKK